MYTIIRKGVAMRDPGEIYVFYTSIGVAQLHNQLLNGSVHLPGDDGLYITMYGPLNETIELRKLRKDGAGVLLYKLFSSERSFTYKQPTFVDYHNLFNVGDRSTEYPPMQTFIRRFYQWMGGNVTVFSDVVLKIRQGDIARAAQMYADMTGISLELSEKVAQKLYDEMLTKSGTYKRYRKEEVSNGGVGN
jgi:hypothetical protein